MRIYLYYGYEIDDNLIRHIHKKDLKTVNDDEFETYLESIIEEYDLDIFRPMRCDHATPRQQSIWIIGTYIDSFNIDLIGSMQPYDFRIDRVAYKKNHIDYAINKLMIRDVLRQGKPLIYAVIKECYLCKS